MYRAILLSLRSFTVHDLKLTPLFPLICVCRAPSPLMDAVREKYTNSDKLAEDFSVALRGCELADVMFVVGEDKKLVYGVKAILACRSR